MKEPKKIDLKREEIDDLVKRIESSNLSDSDQKLVVKLIQFNCWLQLKLQEAKISIKRLSSIFGIKRSKKQRGSSGKQKKPDSSSSEGEKEKGSEDSLPGRLALNKGHGRLGEEQYTGAQTLTIPHASLEAGALCPMECGGRLSSSPAGVVIRVTGSPIASATRYVQEKLRCALCGEIYTAPLPKEVSSREKYDEKAKAILALQKYYLGSPFYRIENFQAMIGVPLPDATQFDLVEQVADSLYPVFQQLIMLGAQGEVLHNDDTSVRILSLIKENLQEPQIQRKGMFTTGIVSLRGDRQIVLFFSGRQHAGENLDDVLEHRNKELGKAIQMSDALSANKPLHTETIWSNCLAHGFRKFEEIEEVWPEECQIVMDHMSAVFETDRIAKAVGMNPTERLKLHQCFSIVPQKSFFLWLSFC